MNEHRPPATAITALGKLPALRAFWRLRLGLGWALAGASPLFLLLLFTRIHLLSPQGYPELRLLAWALPWLGLGFGLWLAGRRFACYGAELHAGEGVVLRRGWLWRSETWVPMARLQHLDVSQGPLDRLWGMACLSMHTAGSHDHHTRIEGLPLAEAQALRETLLPHERVAHD